MIEAAAVISLIIGRLEDFAIIVALLLINVLVKYFQENKASNAIELLKRKLSPSARVKRDGKWREVNARELVPGTSSGSGSATSYRPTSSLLKAGTWRSTNRY